MTMKKILLIVGAIACAAGGFLVAQRIEQTLYEERARAAQQASDEHAAALLAAAETWAGAVATAQGKAVLMAFVAGISPAVLAQRRDSIELAAVSLLRVPGVAGIHVFGTESEVVYSSDAKLTTTAEADPRVEWALQATELISRPSTRAGVIDLAVPIESSGNRLAVVWLEFDLARVRDTARPQLPSRVQPVVEQ